VSDELELLRRLGRELAEPDADEVERARKLLEERVRSASAPEPARERGPRLRRRWAVALAAACLLVGSGLGFGIGSSVTPTGAAGGSVVGLGFIPADGWNVTQTGAIAETGVARAVAANVPLKAGDEVRDLPLATLRELPPTGVVIVARFLPRGDVARDERFPSRMLPLRAADAVPLDLPPDLAGSALAGLRLRAAADGYNVEARIFLHAPPSPARLAAVDAQLSRLVMAPNRVTLVVQPTVYSAGHERMTIFGSVDGAGSGKKVTVQFKACGLQPVMFRDAFEMETEAGGRYALDGYLRPFNLGVSGVFRAVSGDDVSAEVPVSQRARVNMRPVGGGRFEVGVWGKTVSFWRRFVLLQRFERTRGVWVTVRRVVLTEGVGSTKPFRPGVRKGTMIRAVFPLSQARPCYLAGVSPTWRA
jgi:hypothetical protein